MGSGETYVGEGPFLNASKLFSWQAAVINNINDWTKVNHHAEAQATPSLEFGSAVASSLVSYF